MIKNILLSSKNILFPKFCYHCDEILPYENLILCQKCLSELTWTNWQFDKDNQMYKRINNYIEINAACSLLYFNKKSVSQSLIHQLKYNNQQEIGTILAENFYSSVSYWEFYPELIIPIPIHNKRLKKRHYNQVDNFSIKLAKLLKCEFRKDILTRDIFQKSQTTQNHMNRLDRLTDSFSVANDIKFYKSIIIIDDVFTSGSTMINCLKKINEKQEVNLGAITMTYAN